MKKKVTKSVKTKGKLRYSLVLKINERIYKAEGNDLTEMFMSIKPEFYKTRGFLTVSNGIHEVKRMFVIPQLKRLFGVGGINTQNVALSCNVKFIRQMLGEINIGKNAIHED